MRIAALGTLVCGLLAFGVQAQVCDGIAPVSTATLAGAEVITDIPGDPLQVLTPPGDRDHFFVVSQDGTVRVWTRGNAPDDYYVFLDLDTKVLFGGEQGLLSLAFPNDWDTNKTVYINYTEPPVGDTVVSAVPVVEQGGLFRSVLDQERVILRISQPEGNHNGGMMLFDDANNLLIATGDGGGGGDDHGVCGNGQNTENLLGKILRIRPLEFSGTGNDCGSGPYSIPNDNPFVSANDSNCDEIWMYGLRNPWRFSMDRQNGDVYIGDVGQQCWEEVNYVAAANAGNQNFGWRQREGMHCFDPNGNPFECDPPGVLCIGSPSCSDPSLVDPILEYGGGGCSVIAGWVYRGCRLPDFDGTFFYGDYCEGFVRSTEVVGGVSTNETDWTNSVDPSSLLQFSLSGAGVDAEGEVYFVSQGQFGGTGTVIKIVPPFGSSEASGIGAPPFTLTPSGPWSWEDVQFNTMVPVSFYRVYEGLPGQTFDCIHASATPTWDTGSSSIPVPGELLAYLVTAVDGAGNETSAGPGRLLANPCPAP